MYPFFYKQIHCIIEEPVKPIPIKIGSFSCIRCNYIVVSPYNTCMHNQCDYCLTKFTQCKWCIKQNT